MPLYRRLLTALAILALLAATPAAAQSPTRRPDVYGAREPEVPEKEGKILRALRTDRPPVIDGLLDDEIWAQADSASGILQWDPDNMQPMTEETVVRVAYDDRFVYVGVHLYDREPHLIARGVGRRDELPPSDEFYVGFDTQHDHLTGYVFGTNPSGVMEDSHFTDDTSSDIEYNAVWEVQARVVEDGWSAEFRIPLSQMRFAATPSGRVVWGFDFRRGIRRRNEWGQWVGRPRGAQGQVSRWGHLVFDEGLAAPRRIEAIPFALARGEAPSEARFDQQLDAGLDLRVGLGRSASLAATVNPDFGQVEADPAVLNLSVFETFFPEKRPFFLQDGRVFVPSYGLFQLFHSRRIGRRPSYFRPLVQGDVLLERPDQTTILGAAKVTGKRTGLTYGVLSALTAEEHARVRTANGLVQERMLEPMTSYNALRLQRDFGQGSNIGVVGTSVVRDAAPDAVSGGIDYRIRWDRNRWQWNGHWAAVRAPDGDAHVTGVGGVTNLNFNSKHWSVYGHVDHFSPDFRITDLGFLRARLNQTAYNVGTTYRRPDPGKVLRNWSLSPGWGEGYNGDGLLLQRWLWLGAGAQLLNFWGANGGIGHDFERYDDLETRGGPPLLQPAGYYGFVSFSSDPRRSWELWLGNDFSRDSEGGWHHSIDQSVEWRASPRLQLALSGGFRRALDQAQWIANDDVTGDGATDHVFGRLRTDVVNVTLRATAAVNRDLTFQGYLQPFVAAGDYDDLKRLAQPKSFDFEPVDAEALGYNPDFNTKSLRGTFVLRWEYVRGSTVFFVWNLQGSEFLESGRFSPLSDVRDVFGAPLDNVFMIKANYWLAL